MNIKVLALLYPQMIIAEADINPRFEQENVSVEKYLIFRAKPQSKLTVYLKPEEFQNKTLTEFLKKILVNGLKVAPENVSFAIVKNPFPSILLKNNPNSLAILFGDFLTDHDNIPEKISICEVFMLSEMIDNEPKKREAWNKMKTILNKIS